MAALLSNPQKPGDSSAEIRRIIETRSASIKKRDLEQMLSIYAPDAVTFGIAPPLQMRGANRTMAEKWLNSYESPISWEDTELVIACSGDVAFSHSLVRVTGMLKNGENVDMTFRASLGFRRRAGKWLIAHEHLSLPSGM